MLPKVLRIRGHIYRVQQVNQAELGKNVADVDNNINIIRIYKRVAPSRKIELILHEAIHAILNGYEWKDEEALCLHLGESLTELIRSNPAFIRHALDVLQN